MTLIVEISTLMLFQLNIFLLNGIIFFYFNLQDFFENKIENTINKKYKVIK